MSSLTTSIGTFLSRMFTCSFAFTTKLLLWVIVPGLAVAVFYLGAQLKIVSDDITNTSLACNNSQETACKYAHELSNAIDLASFDFINIMLSFLILMLALAAMYSLSHLNTIAEATAEKATQAYLTANCEEIVECWLNSDMGKAEINALIMQSIAEVANMRDDGMTFSERISPEDSDEIAENLDPENPVE